MLAIAVAAGALALVITLTVFLILLAVKLFEPPSVALLLVMHFVCGLGLISLLIVNARATRTLRRNGIRVGFLGVRAADLRKLEGEKETLKLGW